MWGSNDDSRAKAELERRKKDDERRAKVAKERSERAFKAKEARKLKKAEDEKRAANLEKKRKEGREEADRAAEELLGGGAKQATAPQIPTLTRAGYGISFYSFSSTSTTPELSRGGGKYMPPGSHQPGVNQQFGKDSDASDQYAHRQGTEPPPSPTPAGPRLLRPF